MTAVAAKAAAARTRGAQVTGVGHAVGVEHEHLGRAHLSSGGAGGTEKTAVTADAFSSVVILAATAGLTRWTGSVAYAPPSLT